MPTIFGRHLPEEVGRQIVDKLPQPDRVALGSTNKGWRALIYPMITDVIVKKGEDIPKALETFPGAQKLRADGISVTPAQLASLEHAEHLHTLSMAHLVEENAELGEAHFAQIAKARGLRNLLLVNTPVAAAAFILISHLPIEALDVGVIGGVARGVAQLDDGSLADIAHLHKLRELYIQQTDVFRPEMFRQLAHLKELESLSLNGQARTEEDAVETDPKPILKALTKVPKLRELSLNELKIDGGGLEAVPDLLVLQRLELYQGSMGENSLDDLARSTSLREVRRIGFFLDDDFDDFGRLHVASLSRIPNLHSFSLHDTATITPDDLSELRTAQSLRQLEIHLCTQISAEHGPAIARMLPQCTDLTINGTRIDCRPKRSADEAAFDQTDTNSTKRQRTEAAAA